MIELDLRVTLHVQGPYLSQACGAGGYGVDAVALRDANGHPLLPGSHVRGRIRESLAELSAAVGAGSNGAAWLGPDADRERVQVDRGLRRSGWYVGDFCASELSQDSSAEHLVTRIQIDPDTGSVKKGSLLVAECAVPLGDVAVFCGCVTLSAGDEVELATVLKWFCAAVAWIPSVGAFRNVGFGRIQASAVTVQSVRDWRAHAAAPATDKLKETRVEVSPAMTVLKPRDPNTCRPVCAPARLLRVSLEEPFCVGGKRRNRNLVGSLRHLSGAVLKGAVAHQLQRILGLDHRQDLAKQGVSGRWKNLCENFSKIRFCAAFPSRIAADKRPLVTPLSLFQGLDDAHTVRDASHLAGPFLVRREEQELAPEFSPDWKSPATNGWEAGMAWPDVELRVRTAVDSSRRRAQDEHLFAQELVKNKQTHRDDRTGVKTGEDALCWLGTVDLHGLELAENEQQALWDDLETLFELAVLRIGKTKARARLSLEDAATPAGSSDPIDNRWVVVLQSPALIVEPHKLETAWKDGKDATECLYRETFQKLSGQSLTLVNHFADQQLHGGFLAHRADAESYQPFLVTEAGSVFVFAPAGGQDAEGQATDPRATIESWSKCGLPLPEWAAGKHGGEFATNPFLPQDGFGEIAVNIPAQLKLLASKQEVRTL